MEVSNDIVEKLKDAIIDNDLSFIRDNISNIDENLRFEDEDNDTPLLLSIGTEGSDAYRLFLDNADLSLVNELGENILHSVIYSQDENRLLEIIDRCLHLIDSRTNDGSTPLLIATSLGNTEMMKILINHGANVNIPDFNDLYPIHLACSEGLLEVVKLLESKNALLKVSSSKGNVPFALAAIEGHAEIVKFLYPKIYS